MDQHFRERNRYGRLLSLIAQSPGLLGIGIDEDTAAIVVGDVSLEVAGRGAVTIVDAERDHLYAHTRRADPILGVRRGPTLLPAVHDFDLDARALLDYGAQPPAAELAEIAATETGMRKLANEIAREGVSPGYDAERKRRPGPPTGEDGHGSPIAAGESRAEATEPLSAGAETQPTRPEPGRLRRNHDSGTE